VSQRHNKVFVNGKVHVRRTMCATCIFRPGNLMNLTDDRVNQMVIDATRKEGTIPCHKHLYDDQPIEPVCRGFFDKHSTPLLQVADRLGYIEWYEDSP
jgi:hypothetical protein